MNKARLNKVVKRLREVRVLHAVGKIKTDFDMGTWGRLADKEVFKNRKDMSCMTAACAIGHCGTLFKKEGFKLVKHEMPLSNYVVPVYKNHTDYQAVAALFSISRQDAVNLFCPDSYTDEDGNTRNPDAGEVADRIEDFIHGIMNSE